MSTLTTGHPEGRYISNKPILVKAHRRVKSHSGRVKKDTSTEIITYIRNLEDYKEQKHKLEKDEQNLRLAQYHKAKAYEAELKSEKEGHTSDSEHHHLRALEYDEQAKAYEQRISFRKHKLHIQKLSLQPHRGHTNALSQ